MKKKEDFENISVILKRIINRYNLGLKFLEVELKRRWDELVGKKVSKYIKPLYIKNRILYVEVKNSIWNNELNFLKKEIINSINKNINKDMVKNVKTKIKDG